MSTTHDTPPTTHDGAPPDGGRVLLELARIAFADLTGMVAVRGGAVVVTDSERLTADQRAALAEVSATTTQHGGTVKVKLHDKLRALELLGRHLGVFSERPGGQRAAMAELHALLGGLTIEEIMGRLGELNRDGVLPGAGPAAASKSTSKSAGKSARKSAAKKSSASTTTRTRTPRP